MEADLLLYEGLIFRHATRIAEIVEDDLDDIRQFYRVKAWRALESFDGSLSRSPTLSCRRPCADGDRCPRCKYVFMCLKNGEKDLLKKKRHNLAFIEDQAPTLSASDGDGQRQSNWFEARFLSTDHEGVYGGIDEGKPLLPNTLTGLEVEVIVLLYRGYRQSEIAREMVLGKGEIERTMVAIRTKMMDWRPPSAEDGQAEVPEVEIPVAA